MISNFIERASRSNPQVFREFKERLTSRNIALSILAGLGIPALVLLYFNGQIPVPNYDKDVNGVNKLAEAYSRYCLQPSNIDKPNYTELCKLIGADGYYQLDWGTWWLDVFQTLSWLLPLGLILGSVYLLVADLLQEEKRGTLNFIRLSPQSTQSIFSGKIIGVPILVYIAAALVLPFHLWAGLNAGASIPLLAGWYAAVGALWLVLSSTSLTYVLLGGFQAIVTTLIVAYPICMPIFGINYMTTATIKGEDWLNKSNDISWFWLPVFSNALCFDALVIGCCAIGNFWVWQTLDRRYLNPTSTTIGKVQSYFINLCFQIGMAGFIIPALCTQMSAYTKWPFLATLGFVEFVAFLAAIPMLLPNKQAIQDWSRYRRERVNQSRKFWKRDLVRDLVTNDKSPALVAIAINVLMAVILWAPTSIFADYLVYKGSYTSYHPAHFGLKMLGCVCLAASLILIYAAIAHLCLFLKVKKRNFWTLGIIGCSMFLPLVIAYVLSPNKTPTGLAGIVMLFSPFAPFVVSNLSGMTILGTFFSQLAIFGVMARQLQRRVQISGRSQTKELLAQN